MHVVHTVGTPPDHRATRWRLGVNALPFITSLLEEIPARRRIGAGLLLTRPRECPVMAAAPTARAARLGKRADTEASS